MSDNPITIPRNKYRTLLHELQQGAELCSEMAQLRFKLNALASRLSGQEASLIEDLRHTAKACEDVSRLRIDIIALDRYLREFDLEATPLRPPSRTDIKAAFDASVEFARGEKKP